MLATVGQDRRTRQKAKSVEHRRVLDGHPLYQSRLSSMDASVPARETVKNASGRAIAVQCFTDNC